jgi:D-alanyl-D-alanine carboxypeptidase (penicillin-binding protein 5/6)
VAALRPTVRLLLMLVVAVFLPAGSSADRAEAAATPQGELTTQARQAVVMDVQTGAILFQKNAEEAMSPASMSKLATLAVAFKAIKAGQLKLGDEFVMSVNAWRRGGAPSGTSAMMVPVNTKARLDELLQGIIIQSGNDAAICIAEGMAGSEAKFAELMTAEGRRIGLRNSTFRNATGLYHAEHLTTARDLAVLARYLISEYPEHYETFGQREFNYRKHKFFNRNPLIGLNIGADGMKTGYIKEAGYGMVASAKQGDRRLIVVVNGLLTANDRRDEAKKLIEWGFKNITEAKLFEPGEIVGDARVYGGTRFYVPLSNDNGVTAVLPRYPANQRLRAELIYASPLKPPIKKGDQVAKLRVTSSSNAVNEVPLYAVEDVEPASVWRRGLDSLAHLAFSWMR